jgi:cellulose synthase/poly-beta-1,6-N-acetylglucosamine synthase-like glycosyltransferase
VNDPVELPLVSIVTSSLNQAEFIEDTIRSVLDQDYPNIEYLVVDGGSRDGTIEILLEHCDALRWTSGPDKGQSDGIVGQSRLRGDLPDSDRRATSSLSARVAS